MKSGLAKRLLSLVLTAALFMGNVMPVMAEGNASVSGNNIINSAAVDTDANQPETPVESKSVQDIVVAGVAQDIVVEDTVSENEISTEEVVEETIEESVSENEIPEEVTEEVIEETTVEADESVSINEIPEEEVPLAGTLPVSLEPVTVNGITITVSGPASAFAEGTTVSAVEVEPAEVVIEAAEAEEQAKVMRFKAFDINLVYNGEFVQPLNGEEITVNFEGDLLIPDSEKEDVVVYHVDENDDITKMEAEVATVETEEAVEVETVEMTTTHFSTYVVFITGQGSAMVNVTINHYLVSGGKTTPLFVPDKREVQRNGTISGFVYDGKDKETGEQRFNVSRIKVDGNEKILNKEENYSYTVNPVGTSLQIDVYYTEDTTPSKRTKSVPIAFIDYEDWTESRNPREWWFSGTATQSGSINYYKNYQSYHDLKNGKLENEVKEKLKEEHPGDNDEKINKRYLEILNSEQKLREWDEILNWNNRFACKGAYPNYVISASGYTISDDGSKIATSGAQVNQYNTSANRQIIEGLLESVEDKDNDGKYETINFKYEDPGFFTKTSIPGVKTVVNNYIMEFERTGITYELKRVLNDSGTPVCTNLNEFFPLNGLKNGQKNEFFGMNYEYKFQIDNYIGDMIYTFSGDDDLWVCLDGKVVLDLGGIHQKVSGTVDIWEELFKAKNMSYVEENNSVSYADRITYLRDEDNAEQWHTISIVYMERGGSDSNCNMKFVMPNIIPVAPTITTAPVADLKLLKVNSNKPQEAISGVTFKLFMDSDCQMPYPYGSEVTTDNNGKALYTSLPIGTYYLKEIKYDSDSYKKDDTIYKIKVTPAGSNASITVTKLSENSILTPDAENYYTITNTPFDPIELQFTKEDKYTNAKILDAKFALREKDEGGTIVAENISANANGVYTYSISKAGIYYLEESVTPDGYKVPGEGWFIIVEAVDNDTKLSYSIAGGPEGLLDADNKIIKNEPYASIKFTKVIANTDEAINGAKFKLYEYSENKEGNLIKTVTSETINGEEGIVKFDDLTVGQKYLLEETEAANGYIKPINPWIIEVVYENGAPVQKIYETKLIETDNEKTWIIDKEVADSAKIENAPATGSLTIEKEVKQVDAVHGTAGFIFKIECPDNKTVLYRTISFTEAGKKSVTIENLSFGDYKVTELKALRYQTEDKKAEKIAIINSADGATVSYTNKKVFEQLYSHTDVKVNKVVFNADGTATWNNKDITSTSDSIE